MLYVSYASILKKDLQFYQCLYRSLFYGIFFIQTVSLVGISLKLLPDGPVYPVGTCCLFHVASMSLGYLEVRKNS